MPPHTLAEEILAAVSLAPCRLDELGRVCPDFTWNQIFLEVDRLSRAGLVRLTLEKAGSYRVWAPTAALTERSQVER